MSEIVVVPCMFCGKPTAMLGTIKCDNCWEVTSRLDDFLKTYEGRMYVEKCLKNATMNAVKHHDHG